jgi:calcium-dependent protein kinase
MDKFRKMAMHVIARSIDPQEIEGLYALFQEMDENHDGVITIEEMRKAFTQKGTQIPENDLRALMAAGDANSNGSLDYEEFLTATLSVAKLQKPEVLRQAFREFDIDGDGYITMDELRTVLKRKGEHLEDIEGMVAMCDKDGDGRIDYLEFQAYMTTTNKS